MTDREREQAGALAAGDQQFAHLNSTLDQVVNDARELLATNSPTVACALLAGRFTNAFDADGTRQVFAMQLLAAAAVRLAQTSGPQSLA